jgi:PAS domain S-box-containing protein
VLHVAANGAILRANDEAVRILGIGRDELERRNVMDFDGDTMREDGAPFPASEYPATRALATGEDQGPATMGVRRHDGTVAWAVFRAIALRDARTMHDCRAIVVFAELAERNRAEEDVRTSQEKWRALAENIPDFAIIIDEQGTILFVNRTMPNIALRDVIGTRVTDWVKPEDADAFMERIAHVFATGAVASFETHGLGRAGKPVTYENRLGPVMAGDAVVAAVLIARDVSERDALLEQLRRSERMASVGLLAAGVAHEINNPLTYMLANLEFVLERWSGDPREREVLHEALEGALRVRDIVRDLRTFSRGDAHTSEMALDVHPVLDAAVQIAQHEIRHRAELERAYEPVPQVVASEARLGQVVLNLLVNAAQAIPAHAGAGRIVLATYAEGDEVIIEVRDNGVGIAAEHLSKVFDPFFTTKPVGQGTGLGLSICDNLVDTMRGRIDVVSEEGRGTTVRVRLPAAPRDAERKTPVPLPPPGPAGPARQVLVIDDDPLVLRALARTLSSHAVTIASGAHDALRLLERGGWDLVLCDVMMPQVSGIDLHAEVRRRDPAVADRFVFLTGGVFSSTDAEALARTGRPCLLKPVGDRELLALLADP